MPVIVPLLGGATVASTVNVTSASTPSANAERVVVFTAIVCVTGSTVLASFCPHLPAKEAGGMAVKILVDCSGSMAGDSIAAAKRALQAIVQQ